MRTRAHIFSIILIVFSLATVTARAGQDDILSAQNVIESQIKAFLADDNIRAYSFASPRIQSYFPDPDIFIKMVRRGYAPIHRPNHYTFKDHRQDNNQIIQNLTIEGADGRLYDAQYVLKKQSDGSWKISAVFLKESSDLTS